ncbi:MAG: hypothetical protein CMD02_07535 [Flavobacteriales bacterium]|nr:hypothetical protein [Flavobacteriales bacterium]
MNKEKLISLISNPNLIDKEDNLVLNDITQQYPYFSISHILLSKGLLNTESVRYNRKLKKAALHSIDRTQLFKLITQNTVVKVENKESQIDIINLEDSPVNQEIEDKLNIGTPLEFNENEEHSFSQWLALTKLKKIDRDEEKKEEIDLIDNFIESNPIIKAEKNKFFSPNETAKTSLIEKDELVTETLARVYLEQGHLDKAIEAYKKLSLKYPKKSSLFAEQIKLIEDLKKK